MKYYGLDPLLASLAKRLRITYNLARIFKVSLDKISTPVLFSSYVRVMASEGKTKKWILYPERKGWGKAIVSPRLETSTMAKN